MAGEIILGYDASEGARAALEQAAALARALGTKVVLSYGYGVWQVGGEVGDQQNTIHEMGMRAADEGAARLAELGVDHEVAVRPARPWEALLEEAVERDALMIVVGSHGESPVIGALLGSVPYKLIHQSTKPVLVVPT